MACIYIYGEERAREKALSEYTEGKIKTTELFANLDVVKADSLYELKSKVFNKTKNKFVRYLDYSTDTSEKLEKIKTKNEKLTIDENKRVTKIAKKILERFGNSFVESSDPGSKFLTDTVTSLGTSFHYIVEHWGTSEQSEYITAFMQTILLRKDEFNKLSQSVKDILQDLRIVKFLFNVPTEYNALLSDIEETVNEIYNDEKVKELGSTLTHELAISDVNKLGITGHIDMLGYNNSGILRIFDFKTTSAEALTNYTKLYHYVQLEMYKRLLLQNGILWKNCELYNVLILFDENGHISYNGILSAEEQVNTLNKRAQLNLAIEDYLPIRLKPITSQQEKEIVDRTNRITENLFSNYRLTRRKKENFKKHIQECAEKEWRYTTVTEGKKVIFRSNPDGTNFLVIDESTDKPLTNYSEYNTLDKFVNYEYEALQKNEAEILAQYVTTLRSKSKDRLRMMIRNSENSERLLRNLGKYTNENWEYLQTPLETFGIITMVNRSNPDNTYVDFILLTNDVGGDESLKSPIKLINGELILDDLLSVELLKKYFGYDKLPVATIGNVRLLLALIRIDQFKSIFKDNTKIGNITVLSTKDGGSTQTFDFDPFVTALKILQAESESSDFKFENKELFKTLYSDFSDLNISNFLERTSLKILDAVRELSYEESLRIKFPDNFSQFSKEAKLAALEKLELELESYLRGNNEWAEVSERTKENYIPSEKMALYMTVGQLINTIKDMPTTESATVSKKAFTFRDSLYAAAQLLLEGKMRQYTPDGLLITGLAQGLNSSSAYTSPDENTHRVNLAIDTYMAVLRLQFIQEIKEINEASIKFLEWNAKSMLLGKLQDYALGYHTDAYMLLMKKDINGQIDRAFLFINPYSGDQKKKLVKELLDFLETILWHINRFRMPLKPDIKKLSYEELKNSEFFNEYKLNINNNTKWLNIPIKANSTIRLFIQGAKEILVGDATETRKEKLEDWANNMWARIKECYDPKYLTRSQTDRKKRAEDLLEPFNYYDEGSSRTLRINKQRPSEYEMNLNYLCVDYVFCAIKEKIEKDLLRTVDRQISGLLLYESITGQSVSNQVKAIIDRTKVSIYNDNLIDEDYKDLATLIGIGKQLGSYTKIALRPMLYAKELLAGRIRNISALCADFIYNGEKITAKHMLEAAGIVFGEGLFFEKGSKLAGTMHAGNFALVDWINNVYAITDRDMNIYSERLSADRYGVGNTGTRTLYNNTVRPDWFNRMIIFIAKMKADGCWEAHSLKDNQLVYNMKEDKRFDEFCKHRNEAGYTSENFRRQKALFEAMMNDFIVAGFRDKNGEKLTMNSDLPMAYTPKERNSIKELIGALYGYYDHEEKPLFLSDTWYNLFMLFTTYIPGELKRWFNTGKNSSVGHYIQLKDEKGNLLYVYLDPNTQLDIVTTEKTKNGVELQPYTKWEGHQVEGLAISLFKTAHDLCTLQIKEKLNDPIHAERYKQQYKNSALALFLLLFMGLIGYFILMLMTGGTGKKNEMSQLTAIMYDLVTKAANDISFYNSVVLPVLGINFAGLSYFSDMVGDTFKAFSNEDYTILNTMYDNLSILKDTHLDLAE